MSKICEKSSMMYDEKLEKFPKSIAKVNKTIYNMNCKKFTAVLSIGGTKE